MASGNGVYPFLFLWFRINFNFCNKSAKNFFSPLPFSLMPCDSLNCRHSDAAADVAVAVVVAVGFAVYRTFLALPLHTLGRAQKISLGARFETMTNMQIYVVAGWQTWQRNQTDKLRAKTRTKQTRSERSRMHQVKVKNFRRATRKSVLKSIKKFSVCIRWRFMSISHPIWTAPNAALLTPTNCVPVMFASSESCESFV